MSLDGEIMSNQKSFSFSYKLKDSSKNDANFDAHINVWNVANKKMVLL